MNLRHAKRGTGRTHNMIAAAFNHAADVGHAVVVMTDDTQIARAMQNFTMTPEFAKWCSGGDVKLHNSNYQFSVRIAQTDEHFTIKFVNAKNVNIEWYQFRLIGTLQSQTFFDHAVIEDRFAEVLNRWARYDNINSNLSCKTAQEYFDRERQKIESP